MGALLPHLSTITTHAEFRAVRLSVSVALSRVSPPADVIRYPFPGSPDFPHGKTFRHDTARLPDGVVIRREMGFMLSYSFS